MLGAIECAAEDGADGVALRALHPAEHRLDLDAMKSFTARAHALGLNVTYTAHLMQQWIEWPRWKRPLNSAYADPVQRNGLGRQQGAQAGLATLKQCASKPRTAALCGRRHRPPWYPP